MAIQCSTLTPHVPVYAIWQRFCTCWCVSLPVSGTNLSVNEPDPWSDCREEGSGRTCIVSTLQITSCPSCVLAQRITSLLVIIWRLERGAGNAIHEQLILPRSSQRLQCGKHYWWGKAVWERLSCCQIAKIYERQKRKTKRPSNNDEKSLPDFKKFTCRWHTAFNLYLHYYMNEFILHYCWHGLTIIKKCRKIIYNRLASPRSYGRLA